MIKIISEFWIYCDTSECTNFSGPYDSFQYEHESICDHLVDNLGWWRLGESMYCSKCVAIHNELKEAKNDR